MTDSPIDRFRIDTHSTIESLEHLLGSPEFTSAETVHRLFRNIHSMKSEAASHALEDFARSANDLESMLSRVRDGEVSLDESTRGAVLESLEALHDILDHSVADRKSAESSMQTAAAVEERARPKERRASENLPSFDLDEHARAVVEEAVRRNERLWRISCHVAEAEEMLYPRLYLIVSNLEQCANVIATAPPMDRLPASLREFHVLVSGSDSVQEEIVQALSIDGVSELRVSAVSAESLTDHEPAGFAQALMLDEQLSIGAAQVEELRIYADELGYQLSELSARLRDGGDPSGEGRARQEETAARVDLAEKLSHTLLQELSRHSQVDLTTLLGRVVNTAESDAERQEKRVRVHTEGGRHHLFLPVAEVLGESILHLVRNAVAHGIEPIEARRRLGKPEVGRIQIAVTLGQAGGVVVRVTDDGAGIAGEGSKEELLDRLSAPGYTTRSEPTEHSGRGVGLDVVRYNVEKLLSGDVAIDWNAPGEGCAFVLRIPNPGTVLGVLVVRAGKQLLAIPRVYVQARSRVDHDQLATDNTDAYFYRYGSSYLRVFTPGDVRLDDRGLKWAIVLRLPTRRVALVVDECISEELVVRRSANRSEIYSKSLDQAVQLFLPLRFL